MTVVSIQRSGILIIVDVTGVNIVSLLILWMVL